MMDTFPYERVSENQWATTNVMKDIYSVDWVEDEKGPLKSN